MHCYLSATKFGDTGVVDGSAWRINNTKENNTKGERLRHEDLDRVLRPCLNKYSFSTIPSSQW